MTIVFADTAFLVACLSRRDAFHALPRDYLLDFEGRFVTTQWIFCEVGSFFAASPKRSSVVELFRQLTQDFRFTIVPATADSFESGLLLFEQRADKQWSLTDCISMEIMRREKTSHALTTDHHFEQAGFEILLK